MNGVLYYEPGELVITVAAGTPLSVVEKLLAENGQMLAFEPVSLGRAYGRAAPDDPGFAVFGRVVDGMEVVRAILAAPKSATEGEGFMRGQMLEPRVRIVSARRIEAAAP